MKHQRKRRHVTIAMNMSVFAGQQKLAGIFDYLGSRRHWDLHLIRADADISSATMQEAVAAGLDGLMLLNFPRMSLLRHVMDAGIPCVVETGEELLSRLSGAASVVGMSLDTPSVMEQAAAHFADQHVFQSYGFVAYSREDLWSRDRRNAFTTALSRRGLDCEIAPTETAGLLAWLKSLRKPAAVLAANDETAQNIYRLAVGHGISVPRDLAILGIDNSITNPNQPQIDSVGIDFRAAGHLATQALDRLMSGHPSQPIRYGVSEIVLRGTSVKLGPSFGIVQEGLNFIERNACSGIFVDDVVKHLGVSRRLADLRFHQTLGRTILTCIRDCRIAEAARLLRETDLPIAALASRVGIPNANHLKNIFLRQKHQSMRAYRADHRVAKGLLKPQDRQRHCARSVVQSAAAKSSRPRS